MGTVIGDIALVLLVGDYLRRVRADARRRKATSPQPVTAAAGCCAPTQPCGLRRCTR